MIGRFETVRSAARLLCSGDVLELCRRLRVRVIGNWSVKPPTLPLDATLSDTVAVEAHKDCIALAMNRDTRRSLSSVPMLMFAHNLNYEGAPISQYELTKALAERKSVAPEVIAFNDGPLRSAYEARGISVTVIPSYLGRIPTLARLDKVIGELAAIIRDRKPGVVYANTLLTFAAIMAAHEAGIPSIWNPRESEPWDTYFGFLSRSVAQRALAALTLPYRVVFVAEASRQGWSRFDVRRNFTVICNSLDMRSQDVIPSLENRIRARKDLGYAEDAIVFLCAGTICERKGQRDLVGAFSMLPDSVAGQVQLCIIGDEQAGYAKSLHSDIGALPKQRRDNIRIYPATPEIRRHYAAADVFILCSRVESYPRVILEAMAHGLPIITTPVFGVLEQVSENENAIFYKPGNTGQLANSIALLVEDQQLREHLARGSLYRSKKLNSFEEMVSAYEAVFHEALLASVAL